MIMKDELVGNKEHVARASEHADAEKNTGLISEALNWVQDHKIAAGAVAAVAVGAAAIALGRPQQGLRAAESLFGKSELAPASEALINKGIPYGLDPALASLNNAGAIEKALSKDVLSGTERLPGSLPRLETTLAEARTVGQSGIRSAADLEKSGISIDKLTKAESGIKEAAEPLGKQAAEAWNKSNLIHADTRKLLSGLEIVDSASVETASLDGLGMKRIAGLMKAGESLRKSNLRIPEI